MVFYNLFIFLNNEDAVKGNQVAGYKSLEDEQLEVKFKLWLTEILINLKKAFLAPLKKYLHTNM